MRAYRIVMSSGDTFYMPAEDGRGAVATLSRMKMTVISVGELVDFEGMIEIKGFVEGNQQVVLGRKGVKEVNFDRIEFCQACKIEETGRSCGDGDILERYREYTVTF